MDATNNVYSLLASEDCDDSVSVNEANYAPYTGNVVMNMALKVECCDAAGMTMVTFISSRHSSATGALEGVEKITGKTATYTAGSLGIFIYAHTGLFDNFQISPLNGDAVTYCEGAGACEMATGACSCATTGALAGATETMPDCSRGIVNGAMVSAPLQSAPIPPTPANPDNGIAYTSVTSADFVTSGSCFADGDVLSVTQTQNSQMGECYFPMTVTGADTVRIAFDMYCGDGSGADGMCVNLGINSLGGRVGEDGFHTGAALCFDEWSNGGDHGVMMFYNGSPIWQDLTAGSNRVGEPPVSYFEDATWHSVVFDIVPSGADAMLSFTFDGSLYMYGTTNQAWHRR